MKVRSAGPGDFPDITRLLEQLGRPAVTPRTRTTCHAIYAAQLDDPDCEHLVAVTDRDAVIGFCSLHFRARLNNAAPQAWIPDLFVEERSRGAGVARALLAEAEQRARARGCSNLTLESGYDRKAAHVLYAGSGMKDAGKYFGKRLD